MTALERAREVYDDPSGYVRHKKNEGARLIGYFADSLPLEYIDAAGGIAHRIRGYPAPDPMTLDKYLDALLSKAFWQVRQSNVEFINHSFGRIIEGAYSDLDAIIIPNTRKPLLNLYGQFLAAEDDDPSLDLPKRLILDRAATGSDSAVEFNRRAVEQINADIEVLSGAEISDEKLCEAAALRNANRLKLKELNQRRRAGHMSGSDFLVMVGCYMFMSMPDFSELAGEVLEEPPGSAGQGAKVFLGGSPADHPMIYELIEAEGAQIVGEGHSWGERTSLLNLDIDADIHAQLADRWTLSPASEFRLPFSASLTSTVDMAKASGADCVILNVHCGDEMQTWETPGQIEALKAAGIPVLHLSEQPHIPVDVPPISAAIRTFLSQVRASEGLVS